jgi:hypothetical protein
VTKSFRLLTAEVGLDEDTPNKAPRPALPDNAAGYYPNGSADRSQRLALCRMPRVKAHRRRRISERTSCETPAVSLPPIAILPSILCL